MHEEKLQIGFNTSNFNTHKGHYSNIIPYSLYNCINNVHEREVLFN